MRLFTTSCCPADFIELRYSFHIYEGIDSQGAFAIHLYMHRDADTEAYGFSTITNSNKCVTALMQYKTIKNALFLMKFLCFLVGKQDLSGYFRKLLLFLPKDELSGSYYSNCSLNAPIEDLTILYRKECNFLNTIFMFFFVQNRRTHLPLILLLIQI